jgi:hypothetical protein
VRDAIRTGALGCVTVVNPGSGKVLDRADMPDQRFNTGHVAARDDGAMVVVSAPRDGLPSPHHQLGAVSFRERGGALRVGEAPKSIRRRMLGESLSVALWRDRPFVTHPDGDLLTVWERGQFFASVALTAPRGVCVVGGQVIVSHRLGASVALSAIDAETLAVAPAPLVNPSFTSGSHLFHDRRSPTR